ncbi:MAG TPA: carboxy terminal-processing peptidase, partial [Pirellulaceae bacterium]
LFNVPDPPNFGALKITMQQFYRPCGDSTQKRGVLSDVILPSLTSQMDVGEADLDYAIEFDRVQASRHDRYDQYDKSMLESLRRNSNVRVAASEDFQRLQRNIERFNEQKARKFVTLNRDEFMRQRAEVDAEKEEEKEFEEQMDYGDRPVFERDFYNNEVLAVAIDYVRLLQDGKFVHVPQAAADGSR